MLGENLIFIISLPRSGSTMLQQLLSNNTEICTEPEPWLLLPLLNLHTHTNNTVPFDCNTSNIANTEFLKSFDDKSVRIEAIRKYANHLYGQKIKEKKTKYFLDKTSRYYLNIEQIFEIYPNAKYIFLYRNPASVFLSYLKVMMNGNLAQLNNSGIKHDLLKGYELMKTFEKKNSSKICAVNYEQIVENPESELSRLMAYIGLDSNVTSAEYDSNIQGILVDPKSIRKHDKPVKDYLSNWNKIDNRFELEILREYLANMGGELVAQLGYSFQQMLDDLDSKISFFPKEKYYLGLEDFLRDETEINGRLWIKKEAFKKSNIASRKSLLIFLLKNPFILMKYILNVNR